MSYGSAKSSGSISESMGSSSGHESSWDSSGSSHESGGSSSSSSSSSSSMAGPFGLLTIAYVWHSATDLDTKTGFLSGNVGYGLSATADYMTWTGDDVGTPDEDYREVVTVDLDAAWAENQIGDGTAVIELYADWFPNRPNESAPPIYNSGTGGIDLGVAYEIGGVLVSDVDYEVPHPGGYADIMPSNSPGSGLTPSGTHIGTVTVHQDGTVEVDIF